MIQYTPIKEAPVLQRARGQLTISAICDRDGVSRLETLRQAGSYRAIFPRPQNGNIEAVIINTAGGVTGGDDFSTTISAHRNASLSITTQAAERIYRATSDFGRMKTTLTVDAGAQLHWLPQETILFEGCDLKRSLEVEVHPKAKFLMVEPLVFGRQASGEILKTGAIQDRVSLTSEGRPIYLDHVQMEGDLAAMLQRNAVAAGARAMASLVLFHPNAKQRLTACRDLLPQTGGASLLADNVLMMRLLAADSFALRSALLPILQLMTDNTVPKNWRL